MFALPDRNKQIVKTFVKFMRGADSLSARVHAHLAEYNLTVSQFGVLEALYHLGNMCQRDIGKKILKSGGNITTVIDNLEKRKLVKRTRKLSDRRYFEVDLTDAGRKLIKEIFPVHVKKIVKEFEVLSNAELISLGMIAGKIGLQEKPAGNKK